MSHLRVRNVPSLFSLCLTVVSTVKKDYKKVIRMMENGSMKEENPLDLCYVCGNMCTMLCFLDKTQFCCPDCLNSGTDIQDLTEFVGLHIFAT